MDETLRERDQYIYAITAQTLESQNTINIRDITQDWANLCIILHPIGDLKGLLG